MIKHIFADMDGTLLNPDGDVTPATVRAIKAAKIPMTLVSARAPMEMATAIDALGLTDAQIAFNGGLIFQRVKTGWRYISECGIATQVATTLLDTIATDFPEVSLSYYDRSHWYTGRIDRGITYEQRLTGQKAIVTARHAAFAQPDFKVFKIMMITFDADEMAALNRRLTGLALPGVSIQQSGATYLEITSADAKKSRGIAYILTKEQLQPAATAGFGDGYNDLPMLNMVGLPIVMANAFPDVKAAAKFVTRSNAEDGVAYALNTLPEFHA